MKNIRLFLTAIMVTILCVTTTAKESFSRSDIIYANDHETFLKLQKEHKLLLVDFFAVWCPPCKKLTPIVEKVATAEKKELVVAKINTDKNKITTEKFTIKNIPTLILFKDGKEVWRNVGVISEVDLRMEISKHKEK